MSGRLLIVSNRLPIVVRLREGQVQLLAASGGLATGLARYHAQSGSVWIGWPGDLSRLSAAHREAVARQLDERRIVPVALTAQQVKSYYEEFANGVIWPLFHYLLDRIPLHSHGWQTYRAVNEQFAEAIVSQYRPGDAIWIHDYQLMLVPSLVRARLPDASIGFFLHIPFPTYEALRTLPWRQAVLEGLLGADLVGFHTLAYARSFTWALRRELGLEPQVDRVSVNGRAVRVRAFPMGIDAARFEKLAADPRVLQERDEIRAAAEGRTIILGVDRLDYTKGIPRRLLAFELLLEQHPELRDRVRLIQVAVPSRIGVLPYQEFRRHLDELVGRINGAYGTPRWVPVHYMFRSISPRELVALYRAADVMLVTALRDGMNLVAKEFVASRLDEDGVLVLSEFAGASEELSEAVIINPYDVETVAGQIKRAIDMPREERRARMRALRQRVGARTVQRWAEAFLNELRRPARRSEPAPAAPKITRPEDLVSILRAKPGLTLLIDYDGTLLPLASLPELARPDHDALALLRRLTSAGIQLHIVSGRNRDDLTAWLGDLPVALWAEHGAWHRDVNGGPWQPTLTLSREWIAQVRPILDQFAAYTPGALVEEKTSSIAWHYRTADPEFGTNQARELKLLLLEALQNQPLDVLEGSKVIEVRWRGVNKARVVERVLAAGVEASAMVAFGDDRTDEEMFAAMPPGSISIHVGSGPSAAAYRLRDPAAVRSVLAGLAD